MFKFEVGKLYRIGGNVTGNNVGKVIRITERKAVLFGNRYHFEMVHGEPMMVDWFDENSAVGKGLIPVREMIVIYRKDNKVVAVNKATGEEGVARCAPDDTFNFETGAKLAFKRLVGEDTVAESVKPEEPKFKVGEFVRVVGAKGEAMEIVHFFPIGQIVEIVSIDPHGKYTCKGVVKTRVGYVHSQQIVNADHIEKLEEA